MRQQIFIVFRLTRHKNFCGASADLALFSKVYELQLLGLKSSITNTSFVGKYLEFVTELVPYKLCVL